MHLDPGPSTRSSSWCVRPDQVGYRTTNSERLPKGIYWRRPLSGAAPRRPSAGRDSCDRAARSFRVRPRRGTGSGMRPAIPPAYIAGLLVVRSGRIAYRSRVRSRRPHRRPERAGRPHRRGHRTHLWSRTPSRPQGAAPAAPVVQVPRCAELLAACGGRLNASIAVGADRTGADASGTADTSGHAARQRPTGKSSSHCLPDSLR